MTVQPVTPELRAWIVAQASAGQTPDVVLKAMLASGWNEEVAIGALEQTLREHLSRQAEAAGLPAPSVVPEPLLEGSATTTLRAHDRDVHVVMAMRNPRVIVFGGLISDAECDELVACARQRLVRSETVEMASGGTEVNEARTSEGMFFARAETALIERLEARIGALLDWPIENGEGLQILRYRPGAQYKPHYDYFDPAQSGTASILKRGGQRVASLVCYLNTPDKGGATVFPDVHLDVAPCKGNAVFFSYDRPHPLTRSLHGGAPVIEGEKWVATKWLREGRFD
jgi:prolyl 4-hydroxylase